MAATHSPEYTWSSNTREKIIQLNFQLTRTSKTQLTNLRCQFDTLIVNIKGEYKTEKISLSEYVELVTVLYKLIANTRDIVAGKGEYSLAYMLLLTWHTHYPVLARRMLDFFVEMDDQTL